MGKKVVINHGWSTVQKKGIEVKEQSVKRNCPVISWRKFSAKGLQTGRYGMEKLVPKYGETHLLFSREKEKVGRSGPGRKGLPKRLYFQGLFGRGYIPKR